MKSRAFACPVLSDSVEFFCFPIFGAAAIMATGSSS